MPAAERMTHLILCREYPPAPYPAGGIGTYAHHIARLLAEAGQTVHVVAQLSAAAPDPIATSHSGRLIVHRLRLTEPIDPTPGEQPSQREILFFLAHSTCPTQLFSWQAARYVERLLETEPINVIEAQEWEAPLYYLQARRAAGLGPARRPPCIVHLHSPTQLIWRYNEWDPTLTDYLPLVRFEAYTIRAADAVLCPSNYLARQVTELFQLSNPITVIPYAMGVETPVLRRSPEIWSRNSVCFVGRLELRKGVLEWVDAAVQMASQNPSVSFDFFGSDTSLGAGAGPSVLNALRSRIPRPLRSRFRFHGSRSRAELLEALAQTSLAVVPSRWENFPFTCIEAMSTGLPVIASPNGGMAEMVVDNESGWIAPDATAAGLAKALDRALATTPDERAAMGARAAETIRRICDNDTILARQIAFRKEVARVIPPAVPALDPAQTFPQLCTEIFVKSPKIGLIAPWIIRGPKPLFFDPGPCPVTLDPLPDCPLPPGAVIRPEILARNPSPTWSTLRDGNWTAMTYPGPPIVELPRLRGYRPRYSGMTLIVNQSAAFALQWFLAAPLQEKFRLLGRVLQQPQRLLRVVRWRR